MDRTDLRELLYSDLPNEIIQLPSVPTEDSLQYVKNFLSQNLPSSDSKNLTADLKWNFLLKKHSFEKIKTGFKGKKSFLTRKQRKDLNLLKVPREGWDYEQLENLRDMWRSYMRENLDLNRKAPSCTDQEWNAFSVIVAKSELIGAEITVVRSKVPSLLRMRGTIVLETKMTFQIVTAESKLKILIKADSVFEFQLDNIKFTVFGKYLMTKPSERSTKKIRSQMTPDL
ncbi:unnamed protein product [Diabrotica balteata]|uniref:Ribonuclease P protein subunit p29 n=1 Tax=Diabrotica balteata TaxID=107213 RepID=A0A9N9XA64_DIABA|nr:unnamed protein product [Diabrotica balteata]